MKTCLTCGKPVINRRKYCSERCRRKANYLRWIDNKPPAPKKKEMKECAWCGKLFLPMNGTSRYCSADCRVATARKRDQDRYKKKPPKPVMTVTCMCGTVFETTNPRQIYCSSKCCVTAARMRAKEQREADRLLELNGQGEAVKKRNAQRIRKNELKRLGENYRNTAEINAAARKQHTTYGKYVAPAVTVELPEWARQWKKPR